MRVTVLIPCRGHARFLPDAIDSVLSQETIHDVRPFIVCDNDDDAFSVCKTFEGVSAVNLAEHSGVYVSLNTGLSKCGDFDWVTFCGADDLFTLDRVESLLGVPDLTWRSVLNSHHTKIDSDGLEIAKGVEALGGVFMYHKKMLDRLGGFRPWPCSADTDLYNRAIRSGGRRTIVNKSSYRYRQHGDQLTHRDETRFGSPVRRAFEARMGDSVRYVKPKTASVKETL